MRNEISENFIRRVLLRLDYNHKYKYCQDLLAENKRRKYRQITELKDQDHLTIQKRTHIVC